MNDNRAARIGDAGCHPTYPPTLGATYLGDGHCRFRVWAPKARHVAVKTVGDSELLLPMTSREHGYFDLSADLMRPGTRYLYRLNGDRDRPDPASRFQPEGVHGPSMIVDPHFEWEDDAWQGLPLCRFITYELHVGTFSEAGTFDGVIAGLDQLVELGVTAIELMPVAQFPGSRNWGYDGVHPFAVQDSYGGPAGMKRLVNACHRRGLAVVLDVVYNHLGPEGNYLGDFGHYFTDRYRTPWGQAVNFDGRHSDEVRRFFIENALHWISEYHVDTLRLDAVHAIFDFSARPFLQELAEAVRLEGERLNRRVYTIAESSLNDARLIRSAKQGGLGLDGQWCDDLHHALRTSLLGEQKGYYADFHGYEDLVKTYRDGFALDGRYSVFRGRRHGNSARDIEPEKLVVCSQNHDQVGNRMLGERLSELTGFEELKLAAGVVLLSPYQPLLFMGEEYGEIARFHYFVSHLDPDLLAAVRRGRREEFAEFQWNEEPPDPAAEETFLRSRLNRDLRQRGSHRTLWNFYCELIRLRKTLEPLAWADRARMKTVKLPEGRAFAVYRWTASSDVVTLFHVGTSEITVTLPLAEGNWTTLLDSAAACWAGPGTRLPATTASAGAARLSLPPRAVIVLAKPVEW